MFIYFIQKKGFLNNDENYLRTKLTDSQSRDTNQYYKEFLCPLFFEGFAKPEAERSREMKRLLGKIPYLNGGIFQKHQIETLHGENIEIPDKAFEQIFNFFEQYQWHLDDRPLKNDNEINPDVLGYIFEKVHQPESRWVPTTPKRTSQSTSAKIPSFRSSLTRRGNRGKIAFEGDTTVWQLACRKTQTATSTMPSKKVSNWICQKKSLPESMISPNATIAGTHSPLKNTPYPQKFGGRPSHAANAMKPSAPNSQTDEIRDINDLITYNLDIRQFAQDVIENCEGPELLRAFWKAITQVTILDPTCGSGAFLFAALNILEPLYEACLDRMQVFLRRIEVILLPP